MVETDRASGGVGVSQLSLQLMTGYCESLGFITEPVAPLTVLSGAVAGLCVCVCVCVYVCYLSSGVEDVPLD